ncbi:hypothetical protein V8J88_08315 [Massilia sp. W12]|uniref:hypothetical protein n=1 Tax=Massilia sp. W12 TaxID=3126507 RepID=UPI0030CAA9FB
MTARTPHYPQLMSLGAPLQLAILTSMPFMQQRQADAAYFPSKRPDIFAASCAFIFIATKLLKSNIACTEESCSAQQLP